MLTGSASAVMDAANTGSYVSGDLDYLIPTTQKPYTRMYQPPPGVVRKNCEYERRSCRIQNARRATRRISLESHGFELVQAPTGVVDFYDPEEVADIYYREARDLALQMTGGSMAVVFDHQLRARTQPGPPSAFGRHGDGSNPAAVGRVHNDYSDASAKKRLNSTFPDVACDRAFVILNFWRPVLNPALDAPLALCDASTVSAQDWVAADIIYPTRTGEIYLATYSPTHRWYYYPGMATSEVLAFKTYDSRLDRCARMTPHCAFDDPTVPANAPLRRSIEARCLVLVD